MYLFSKNFQPTVLDFGLKTADFTWIWQNKKEKSPKADKLGRSDL